MATLLRVGPKHRRDTKEAATEAALSWLHEHRPQHTWHRYGVTVTRDEHERWAVGTLHALWTPDPQPRRAHRRHGQ